MSRGVLMKTPERVAEAQRLRADGLTWRAIGERLGVSYKTAHGWVNDPDGSRLAARKETYRRTCEDCGASIGGYGGGGGAQPRWCNSCAAPHRADALRIWTRDALILAIQEWAHEHGEPPAMADWNAWTARHQLHDEARAQRAEANMAAGRYPSFKSVVDMFGSWNAGIAAAGFEPRAKHGGNGNEKRRRAAA